MLRKQARQDLRLQSEREKRELSAVLKDKEKSLGLLEGEAKALEEDLTRVKHERSKLQSAKEELHYASSTTELQRLPRE